MLRLPPSAESTPNPTFLDARDAILSALQDLVDASRIPPATFQLARRAAWQAFAHFGMGINAVSADADADDVDGTVADFSIPPRSVSAILP